MAARGAGRPADRLEAVLLPGAGLVLVFATLSFGATPYWARAGVELSIVALVGAWLVAGALRGELSVSLPPLFFPLAAIFLLACAQAFAGLSVYAPATRQEVWELVGVGGLFFLLQQQLASSRKLEMFATALLVFAFLLAVFAVLQALSFNGRIYWAWEPPAGGSPFGPFINRNHYAAWVVMVTPLVWMKILHSGSSSGARDRERGPSGGERRLFWGLVLLTLGLSVLLSASRAGAALFLLSFPLVYLLAGRRGRRRGLLLAAAVLVLAAAATLALDTGKVLPRWQTLGARVAGSQALDEYRWQIWRDSGAMIRDHPWLGSGLETFGILSDSYRSFYSNQRWLQAHNDYLQWVAETGLVGAALAVWFLVALGRAAAEKLRLSEREPRRAWAVGALAGCVLVLLHSLVDFPLRIPANALLFAALLAMVTAPAGSALLLPGGEPGSEPGLEAEFRVLSRR